MARPYSIDLRERVIAAVESGLSARRGGGAVRCGGEHGHQLGAAASLDRQRGPGQMGGHKPKAIAGRAPRLAVAAGQRDGLHLAGPGGRTRRARPEGRLSLGMDIRARGEAELQKKACSPANRIVLTSRGGERSGGSIRGGLILPAWFSSTRPGPRPTWRRCAAGGRVR